MLGVSGNPFLAHSWQCPVVVWFIGSSQPFRPSVLSCKHYCLCAVILQVFFQQIFEGECLLRISPRFPSDATRVQRREPLGMRRCSHPWPASDSAAADCSAARVSTLHHLGCASSGLCIIAASATPEKPSMRLPILGLRQQSIRRPLLPQGTQAALAAMWIGYGLGASSQQ